MIAVMRMFHKTRDAVETAVLDVTVAASDARDAAEDMAAAVVLIGAVALVALLVSIYVALGQKS